MKIRTTQPKNNKYYIRTVSGGYNGAVAGKPTISGANVLCNCVGYANGRFNEIGDYGRCKYQLVCNAENFIESAKRQGLKISSTPVQGGIMVWQKGRTLGGGDGAGHVAVVEEVYSDGTILTSESGWNAWAFKTVRRSNSNGRWGQASAYKFRGCIINPAVKDAKVVPAPKLTVDGIGGANTVRATQKFLGTPQDGVISGQNKSLKKYYPSLKAVEFGKGGSVCVRYLQKWLGVPQDGVLGKVTIKAWQYVIGVDDDGIFGENSMKAWQKYLNTHDKAQYPKTPTKTEKPAPSTTITSTQSKIVAKAKSLVGSSSKATSAYKSALSKAYPKRSSWGKSARLGKSCDVFVGTVIRILGIDKDYPRGLAEQFLYKPKGFERKTYKNVTPYSVSKDGDVIIYSKNKVPTKSNRKSCKGHTCIRGNGVIYEANYPSKYPHANKKVKKKLNVKRPYVVVLRAK